MGGQINPNSALLGEPPKCAHRKREAASGVGGAPHPVPATSASRVTPQVSSTPLPSQERRSPRRASPTALSPQPVEGWLLFFF